MEQPKAVVQGTIEGIKESPKVIAEKSKEAAAAAAQGIKSKALDPLVESVETGVVKPVTELPDRLSGLASDIKGRTEETLERQAARVAEVPKIVADSAKERSKKLGESSANLQSNTYERLETIGQSLEKAAAEAPTVTKAFLGAVGEEILGTIPDASKAAPAAAAAAKKASAPAPAPARVATGGAAGTAAPAAGEVKEVVKDAGEQEQEQLEEEMDETEAMASAQVR